MHLRPKHQSGYYVGTLRGMTAPTAEMRVGNEPCFPNFPRICTEEKLRKNPRMLLYVMGHRAPTDARGDQAESCGRDFLLQGSYQPSGGRLSRTAAAASLRAARPCGKWQAKARRALGRT